MASGFCVLLFVRDSTLGFKALKKIIPALCNVFILYIDNCGRVGYAATCIDKIAVCRLQIWSSDSTIYFLYEILMKNLLQYISFFICCCFTS